MASSDAAVGPAPGPSLWTNLAYGFGAVALGVKDNGLSYFLLLFYGQVVGLDARLVSLARTIVPGRRFPSSPRRPSKTAGSTATPIAPKGSSPPA